MLVYDPDLHVLESDYLEISLTDADGNLVWSHTPQAEKQPAPERPEIVLSRHVDSFRAWIEAWARGVDLWEDMQGLP